MSALEGAARVRRLVPADLDAVVAIDAESVGRPRRAYFERRLRAALAAPQGHVQFAVARGGALDGYLLARRVSGEFGRDEPSLRLEVIGVRRDARGRGHARAMLEEVARWAGSHGASVVRTQASWRDHELLRFFARAGFELARNPVIDCDVRTAPGALDEEEPVDAPQAREVEYGAPRPEGALARDRVDVRVLSLDGAVAGYMMARADYGDFGRAEPVAVLDTLGVDPAYARWGVGRALVSQLLLNLRALRVERLETVATRGNFPLLAFLDRAGFGTSATLAFERSAARGDEGGPAVSRGRPPDEAR